MKPSRPLPLPPAWMYEESYVESLLHFMSSNELFQKLCGGVHVLDFFTREPDLYSSLLPEEWRQWFHLHEVSDILDLLLREEIAQFGEQDKDQSIPSKTWNSSSHTTPNRPGKWRGTQRPPESLVRYIQDIRKHSLEREFKPFLNADGVKPIRAELPQRVTVGMKPKKIHEVIHFVEYINGLTSYIDSSSYSRISHVVDFGSGQNYLGRALASPPYCKQVVAIESKQHNIDGARTMDVSAKLAEKEKMIRNKKAFRSGKASENDIQQLMTRVPSNTVLDRSQSGRPDTTFDLHENRGSIQYFEKILQDGNLSDIIPQIQQQPSHIKGSEEPQLIVVSLHSCGNLVHHGIRSLMINPSVKAVAMLGCCYNLMTEKLDPATYKIPSLRFPNERLNKTAIACDPQGYPLSKRLATYKHEHGEGIRLNITARMMAVQAPSNWTVQDSEGFFTRHFFRALLQRIFIDHGVLAKQSTDAESTFRSGSPGCGGAGEAIIIGSLRKPCYTSFAAYVRGAISKLRNDPVYGVAIARLENELSDEDIEAYARSYKDKKKELSIVWSLMAFSASVVESVIVVDRWLYLREHEEVSDCWVEPVFDHKQSPRNLVVVGIKS